MGTYIHVYVDIWWYDFFVGLLCNVLYIGPNSSLSQRSVQDNPKTPRIRQPTNRISNDVQEMIGENKPHICETIAKKLTKNEKPIDQSTV